MEQLKLGVGRRDITPEIGCTLFGYRPNVYSQSLHDRLTATVFWFHRGETHALMVNLTLCNLHDAIYERIMKELKDMGIPEGSVMISCTHTHSGPVTGGVIKSAEDWGYINRHYVENTLIPAILQGAAEAKAALRPVTVGVGVGKSEIGVNRRQPTEDGRVVLGQNPAGSFDPQMTILSFQDEQKQTCANLIHYGCHGTCAGMHTAISRDWSGIMVDRMEEYTGGITAFFNGTAGDTGPRLSNGCTTGKGDFNFVYELGNKAAEDAIRIWQTIRFYQQVSLQTVDGMVELPLQPRPPKAEAQACLQTPFEGFSSERTAYQRHYQDILDSYENGYQDKKTHRVRQIIIRIGDCVFYGLPFELFSKMGLEIRSQIPYALCVGYTNGSQGYFPSGDQIPFGGYEINIFRFRRIQPFVEDADTYLVNDTVKNLEKITKSDL